MIADIARFPIMLVRANAGQAFFLVTATAAVTDLYFATAIMWHEAFHAMEASKQKGLPSVNEFTSDNTVSIDVAFGAIKFIKEEKGTFATVSVDVAIEDSTSGQEAENKVQMDVTFSADPDTETVIQIVDKARRHIIDRLRSAADVVEGKSSAALVFGEPA